MSLEEVTPEWVTSALRRRFQDATVKGVEVVKVMNGTNTKIRLRLDLDDAARAAGVPEMMILKTGFEPHSRDMQYNLRHEVAFYNDVAPTLGLPSPKCWFAEFDNDLKQMTILMEDLVDSGMTFCSALKPMTFEEAAARLEALAAFHAQTWTTPEALAAGRWGYLDEMTSSVVGYSKHWTEATTWKRFIDSPRGAATSVRFHDADWMDWAIAQMAKLGARVDHCVVDGDTHMGNLYIDRQGKPGFFDAMVHRGPPMVEISYMLVCGLDSADRPNWERALVGHYLDELKRHGVNPPSFDEAMFQYGVFLAFSYFVFIINESAFQTEAINTAYVARITTAMIEHDTMGLLKQVS
jgi:aminoglycoside phosphotransferase (APT) family kinase protein